MKQHPITKCPECGGSGYNENNFTSLQAKGAFCPTCKGTGTISEPADKPLRERLRTVVTGSFPYGIVELQLDGKKIAEQKGMVYANWMVEDGGKSYLVQYGYQGFELIDVSPNSGSEPAAYGAFDEEQAEKHRREAELDAKPKSEPLVDEGVEVSLNTIINDYELDNSDEALERAIEKIQALIEQTARSRAIEELEALQRDIVESPKWRVDGQTDPAFHYARVHRLALGRIAQLRAIKGDVK